MKLQVTFDVEDDTTVDDPETGEVVDFVDASHPMGVTNRGYELLLDKLLSFCGADGLQVESVFEG